MVKEYEDLLGQDGNAGIRLVFSNIFHSMDMLKNNINMMSIETEEAARIAAALPESGEKQAAASALKEAEKGVCAAWGFYSRAESMILKGIEASVMGFRFSGKQVSEKPFPAIKTEKELEGLMKSLVGPFAAVDKAVGRIEEARGMVCMEGHYQDMGSGCWIGEGERNYAWTDVLWSLRTTEKLIGQTHDVAHRAADCVEGIRPKVHRVIKKDTLAAGMFWEKERQKAGQETKMYEMMPKEEVKRVSLRNRLEAAKTECKSSHAPVKDNERRIAEECL
ncbi:MAG: hypothetical protein NC389_16320 [Acetatifactor muris]|nr:hypothetical protein [Acetatifactor muris]